MIGNNPTSSNASETVELPFLSKVDKVAQFVLDKSVSTKRSFIIFCIFFTYFTQFLRIVNLHISQGGVFPSKVLVFLWILIGLLSKHLQKNGILAIPTILYQFPSVILSLNIVDMLLFLFYRLKISTNPFRIQLVFHENEKIVIEFDQVTMKEKTLIEDEDEISKITAENQ
ncbi:hypothetical protein RF11_04793 [Thelohanellus kitauei]|uniref:Transmembrane protein n=1 Tax=Thelohanellus kitauei TaxID=669202 RepID=A0A0C2ILB2_THEKT|nr:hypothetical protein RF11_04793 [Thelohanellus kitauei]